MDEKKPFGEAQSSLIGNYSNFVEEQMPKDEKEHFGEAQFSLNKDDEKKHVGEVKFSPTGNFDDEYTLETPSRDKFQAAVKDEKPFGMNTFQYETCDSSLIQHERKHTAQKLFQCPMLQ